MYFIFTILSSNTNKMKSLLLVAVLMACMMALSYSEETFRLKRQSGGGKGKLIGVDLCIPLSLSSDVLGQLLGIL
ncbi:hypothetical protein TNCV_2399031 [Trichonephila clavipes]|uniref:Uncharacterized protein n=1 Tax=Trichonephila clavipes TaxID=2585209 RepID=A0A8X6VMB8_TRICX|nr:hypothetical protein TNCV_2399031 [Trichonephila clavipes]